MVSHLNKIQCPFSGVVEASHDQAPYSLKSHLPLPSPMVIYTSTRAGFLAVLQIWQAQTLALTVPSAWNDVFPIPTPSKAL